MRSRERHRSRAVAHQFADSRLTSHQGDEDSGEKRIDMTESSNRNTVDERLRRVLATHLDPKGGSQFWLARAAALTFDPRDEIHCMDDLPMLGVTNAKDLAAHPLEDFLPASVRERASELVVAQTGGTMGHPVWTAYLPSEFHEAFVEPFVAAAKHVGFPQGGRWLYIGPSGPHIIARAAEAIARAGGSMTPFMVDFDSRWARKLSAESFAAKRYLTHVVEQAMAVIDMQSVDTLFTTPAVLRVLAEAMTPSQRGAIRGVHYGGMAIDPVELHAFQSTHFQNAVHLAGYGNTLFGCCLELDAAPGRDLRYYPLGDRLVFGILSSGDVQKAAPRYDVQGEAGRVVFSRFDESVLLINVLERDEGNLIAPPHDAPEGFHLHGVSAPQPCHEQTPEGITSLY